MVLQQSYRSDQTRPSTSLSRIRWNDQLLDSMRQVGDPLADAAIQALFEQGHIQSVNGLMKNLINNEDMLPTELPDCIRDYLLSTANLPTWADPYRIQRAQRVFSRYGIQIGMILFHGSLPTSYAARKGVHVLALTQRFAQNSYRRILNTAQFLLDTMAPGAMNQNGKGIRSVQKVRLMHAAVRYLLLASGQWDAAEYDVPINQEDLAGTLMMFSSVITRGLHRIGVQLSDQEREDYQHIWAVIGTMLGIMPELIPDTAHDADKLTDIILERHIDFHADNSEGRQLMRHLLKMMEERTPAGKFHAMPQALTRYLVGDRVADLLGIERTVWNRMIEPIRWVNSSVYRTSNTVPVIGKASEVFCRKALEGLLVIHRQGNHITFEIPVEL